MPVEGELFLFFDDGEESRKAKSVIEQRHELCHFIHANTINVLPTESMSLPLLYAPEGIYEGWHQIQTFLDIPKPLRYDALRRRKGLVA